MPKVKAPRAKRSVQEVDKAFSEIEEEVGERKEASNAKAVQLDRERPPHDVSSFG